MATRAASSIITESGVARLNMRASEYKAYVSTKDNRKTWNVTISTDATRDEFMIIRDVAVDTRNAELDSGYIFIGLPMYIVSKACEFARDELGITVDEKNINRYTTTNFLWLQSRIGSIDSLVVGEGVSTKRDVPAFVNSMKKLSTNPVGVGMLYLRFRCVVLPETTLERSKKELWQLTASLLALNAFSETHEAAFTTDRLEEMRRALSGMSLPKPSKALLEASSSASGAVKSKAQSVYKAELVFDSDDEPL